MGSNSPWSPYSNYKDCSQGICSIYCPQWCYIMFSPPPPFDLPENNGDDSSAADFSPLIIAIIGILATVFLLITYFTIISKYCRQRSSDHNAVNPEFDDPNEDQIAQEAHQIASTGLEEAIIRSITVCKYKKGDGLVEGTDCSVCLNEFKDDESLRLLPKCNHAFHVTCIDTWLKSNASCPLCRSNIPPTNSTPPHSQLPQAQPQAPPLPHGPGVSTGADVNVSSLEYRHRNDTVIVVQDLENMVQQEADIRLVSDKILPSHAVDDQRSESEVREQNSIGNGNKGKGIHGIRRSFSLDSSLQNGSVCIADILRKSEAEENLAMRNGGSGESNSRRNYVGIGRSGSTGRLFLSKGGKGKEIR